MLTRWKPPPPWVIYARRTLPPRPTPSRPLIPTRSYSVTARLPRSPNPSRPRPRRKPKGPQEYRTGSTNLVDISAIPDELPALRQQLRGALTAMLAQVAVPTSDKTHAEGSVSKRIPLGYIFNARLRTSNSGHPHTPSLDKALAARVHIKEGWDPHAATNSLRGVILATVRQHLVGASTSPQKPRRLHMSIFGLLGPAFPWTEWVSGLPDEPLAFEYGVIRASPKGWRSDKDFKLYGPLWDFRQWISLGHPLDNNSATKEILQFHSTLDNVAVKLPGPHEPPLSDIQRGESVPLSLGDILLPDHLRGHHTKPSHDARILVQPGVKVEDARIAVRHMLYRRQIKHLSRLSTDRRLAAKAKRVSFESSMRGRFDWRNWFDNIPSAGMDSGPYGKPHVRNPPPTSPTGPTIIGVETSDSIAEGVSMDGQTATSVVPTPTSDHSIPTSPVSLPSAGLLSSAERAASDPLGLGSLEEDSHGDGSVADMKPKASSSILYPSREPISRSTKSQGTSARSVIGPVPRRPVEPVFSLRKSTVSYATGQGRDGPRDPWVGTAAGQPVYSQSFEQAAPKKPQIAETTKEASAMDPDADSMQGGEEEDPRLPDEIWKEAPVAAREDDAAAVNSPPSPPANPKLQPEVEPLHDAVVAKLKPGLTRALFSPGVHFLQDPRTGIYNFPPEALQDIPRSEQFDYKRGAIFIPPSEDLNLAEMAEKHRIRFRGSTSSLTRLLSHVYFAISGFRDPDTSSLSQAFAEQARSYTLGATLPANIVLSRRDGLWAIDSDKTYDVGNVLSDYGHILERMLVSQTPEEFSQYLKSSTEPVPEQGNEAYMYQKAGSLLMRSQLDCHDPRLPGHGTFDIKTRAVLPIRHDRANWIANSQYEISELRGYLESFEREWYDLIRATLLKYSFQARIGKMDGIFLAYHNTAKIFGFEYLPMARIDEVLFGSTEMADQAFKLCVGLSETLLQEAVDAAEAMDDQVSRIKLSVTSRSSGRLRPSAHSVMCWLEPELRPEVLEKLGVRESTFDEEATPLAGKKQNAETNTEGQFKPVVQSINMRVDSFLDGVKYEGPMAFSVDESERIEQEWSVRYRTERSGLDQNAQSTARHLRKVALRETVSVMEVATPEGKTPEEMMAEQNEAERLAQQKGKMPATGSIKGKTVWRLPSLRIKQMRQDAQLSGWKAARRREQWVKPATGQGRYSWEAGIPNKEE